MRELRIGSKTYPLPETWDELTPRQQRRVAPMVMSERRPATMAAALWHLLPGARKRLLSLDEGWIHALAQEAAWLWDKRPVEAGEEVAPMVKRFWWGGRYYALPRENQLDITLEEWMYIDLSLQEMMEVETSEAGLHQLLGVVCRPLARRRRRNWNGSRRVPFNAHDIEEWMDALEGAPDYIYLAVQDYVLRSVESIRLTYAPLFEGPAQGGVNFGYKGMAMSIASTGSLGSLTEVMQHNIHDVLLYAMKAEIERREHEAKMEQIRNRA